MKLPLPLLLPLALPLGCGAVSAIKNPPPPCLLTEVVTGKVVTRGQAFELSGSGQLGGQTHRWRLVMPKKAGAGELPAQYVISSTIKDNERVTSMPTLCQTFGENCSMTLSLEGNHEAGEKEHFAVVSAVDGTITITQVVVEGGQHVLKGTLKAVDFDLTELPNQRQRDFGAYKGCRKARIASASF